MHAGAVSDEHAFGVPDPRLPSHATHVPALQIGVAPEHAASVRHATHVFVVVLHVGVAPPHCVLSRHWTQLIDTGLHLVVRPEQLASLEQPAVHVLVARLQTPFAPVQSAFAMHSTQRWLVVLQTGRPAGHAVTLPALHCTHGPVRHAGSSVVVQAKLWPLPVSPLHATHTPLAVSQMGFEPTHAAVLPAVHSTHLFVVVLHTLFVPVQRIGSAAVHVTHAPVARLHAGAVVVGQAAAAAVPLSSVHATQVPAALHTGVLPPHSADVWHCTHVSGFEGVPQSGVGAAHCAFVRHATQMPAASHFGAAGFVHWLSIVHFDTHLSLMQKGVAPPHCALEVHCTHWSSATSQTGVAPPHAVWSVALHWRHVPPTHAGAVALEHADVVPEPRLPLHAVQTLFVQIGVAAPH